MHSFVIALAKLKINLPNSRHRVNVVAIEGGVELLNGTGGL